MAENDPQSDLRQSRTRRDSRRDARRFTALLFPIRAATLGRARPRTGHGEVTMAVRRMRNKWYVDFRFQHTDGRIERVRKCSPGASKAAAEEFERQLRNAMIAPP